MTNYIRFSGVYDGQESSIKNLGRCPFTNLYEMDYLIITKTSRIYMSELIYVAPSPFAGKPVIQSVEVKETNNSENGITMSFEKDLTDDKAVEVIDGAIEITEELLKEGNIYPITYLDQKYYVLRKGKIVEIFQLSEDE